MRLLQIPIWNLWLGGTPYSMDYGSGSNAYAILKASAAAIGAECLKSTC